MGTKHRDNSKPPEPPSEAEPVEVEEIAREPVAKFPIVGIGASAGGLGAFEAFFRGMPTDASPGMAFVLVQHLAPNHKSLLTELVRRFTGLEVFEIVDGVAVRPNCIYIIPPGRDLAFMNGKLHLLDPGAAHGLRLPVNFFFQSLAEDQRERAIAVVLSGTGSDGTLGVRAIKSHGGMVVAQRPDTTGYDGMPSSAIATGLVDLQLPPGEMLAAIMAYVSHAFGKLKHLALPMEPRVENAMQRVFILLRSRTGHDFSDYKPNTIQRRVERRMAVHQLDTLEEYSQFLQNTPTEIDALFRDLLIGVTSFFRDPAAFQLLEQDVLSKLLCDKPDGGAFRVWVPGCSTGEEAYSIGILIHERLERMKQSCAVQIFATDIDNQAIAAGRAGLYEPGIATHVSAERLARFFTKEAGGGALRINKVIRDMLIFSEQNVIKDPPFSRLDLISCRNLMIYMGSGLQKKLIPLFHHSLNPGGMLFLGTSETVGDFTQNFAPVDRMAKIYRRIEDPLGPPRVNLEEFTPPNTSSDAGGLKPVQRRAEPVKPPLRELTEQALLMQVAPAGALVNARGDILYLYGRTGMYLEPVPGEASVNNILKMARPGLQRELAIALHKAVGTKDVVRSKGLRVQTNGHFTTVDLTIRPVIANPANPADTTEGAMFIVILEEGTSDPPTPLWPASKSAEAGDVPLPEVDVRIEALNRELQAKEEFLQTTREQLGTSNEELRSSNEEMQSVNEEMQSANEELETSKEELQSVNEELATVNAELQTKVSGLSVASNDMNNLLAGTGIATLFVDLQLRIMRFTPAANAITNLLPSDVGRPVGHIVSNLVGYDRLVVDAQAVLDTLIPRQVDVQAHEGKWYTMRIQPYRTLDNVIEGAVITFVEITEVVRAREELRKGSDLLRLSVVVRDASDAIIMQDLEGRILAWNPSAVRMFGWSEDEALSLNIREMIPKGQREDALSKIHQLSRSEVLEPYRAQRIRKDGSVVEISMASTALVDDKGAMYAIATTERLMEAKLARGAEVPDGTG
ncbi:MAG: chemotaxis protein CheB [Candidatus Eisenbacteria bacterium]